MLYEEVAELVVGSHSDRGEHELTEKACVEAFIKSEGASLVAINIADNTDRREGGVAGLRTELNTDLDHDNGLHKQLRKHACELSDSEVSELRHY